MRNNHHHDVHAVIVFGSSGIASIYSWCLFQNANRKLEAAAVIYYRGNFTYRGYLLGNKREKKIGNIILCDDIVL